MLRQYRRMHQTLHLRLLYLLVEDSRDMVEYFDECVPADRHADGGFRWL